MRNYQEESKEHTLISAAAQSAKPARSTLARMANESMRTGQMALVTALFMKLTNDRKKWPEGEKEVEALIKKMNCGVPGQFQEFTALQLITLSIIVTQQFLSRSALHISTNKPSQFWKLVSV